MKFKISRANESKFDSGLRGFFKYRDLGIEEGTEGEVGANIIKAVPGEHAKGDWHYHLLDFQMVLILEGWVTFEYEGEGTFTFKKETPVYQPPKYVTEK